MIGQSNFTTGAAATTAAEFNSPRGIAFDSSGNLWVADRSNDRVLEYTHPFATGEAASLVIGQSSFTTSAAATTATGLLNPRGIAFDSSGNLWLAEQGNNRVLQYGVQLPTAVSPSEVATTASGLAYSRVSQTFNGTLTVENIGGGEITGPLQILFSGTPSNVTLVNASGNLSGTPYLTVPGVASLVPGQSVTVSVQFKNPSNETISISPAIYSGSIN